MNAEAEIEIATTADANEASSVLGETFESLDLSEPLRRALAELGFEGPTPIQRDAIPPLLAGRDVMAQAQTGTGKTAAFGIPLVQHVDARRGETQALVLAPTRELAVQVAEALHDLGRHTGLRVLPVYGGQPYERQLRGLREGAHVVVGTPGRLLDHLRRGTLRLGAVRMVILDEADEMLNMGFLEDVSTILDALLEARRAARAPGTDRDVEADQEGESDGDDRGVGDSRGGRESGNDPSRTQVGLFSATLPTSVRQLARRYLRDPVRIDVSVGQVTVPQIEQVAYEIGGIDKLDALARVLDVETPGSAIVFCQTRRNVDEVADRLAVRGYRCAALHGDMAQAERERVLRRFREGQTEVLVATDVAARGLDVEGVTHVINYDIPWDPESYVHRIGRTARAGRAGDAITLVTPRDYRNLRTIELLVKTRITRKRLPSLADVATRRREAAREAVERTLDAGDLDAYLTLAGELGDAHDPIEVAAAALRLWDLARSTGPSGEDGSTLAGIAEAAAEEQARTERERHARESSRARRDEVRRAAAEFEADGLAPEPGMTRLFVSVGRWDGVRPQDLVGAIANEAGLRGKDIGTIDIYDRFAFVEVPSAQAQAVIDSLDHTTIRGRPVGARPADPREQAGRPAGRGRPGPPSRDSGQAGPRLRKRDDVGDERDRRRRATDGRVTARSVSARPKRTSVPRRQSGTAPTAARARS